ncbi:MAG: DUF2203 domain-containing protein [Candidatus Nitrosocaldaceae archaeon]
MIKLDHIFALYMFKYYTPQQANKILPDIKNKLNLLLRLKEHILVLQEELNRTVNLDNLKYYIEKKQELNKSIADLYKGIEEIESLGVIIKSLDEGLLDFPSKRFDEDVWLCWKMGEGEVKFWHGKDEGFAGRKPLPISDESLR